MDSHNNEWKGDAGDESVRIYSTKVFCKDTPNGFFTHRDVIIEVEGEIKKPVYGMILGFWLYSQFDYQLAYCLYDDTDPDAEIKTQYAGKFIKRFVIPANTLAQGGYRIQFDIALHHLKFIVNPGTCDLEFSMENIAGLGRKFIVDAKGFKGLFRPDWSQEKFD